MAARSPARFLAPLALLAVVVALFMIVSPRFSNGGASDVGTPSAAPTAKPASGQRAKASRKRRSPRFYTVKPGDTPSGIADSAGISLTALQQLNPNLDPQTLSPGERLRLR